MLLAKILTEGCVQKRSTWVKPLAVILLLTAQGQARGDALNNIPASATVLINEWQASNTKIKDPADNDADDWFELVNVTNSPIDLSGWKVSNKGTGATTFSVFKSGTTIPAMGHIVVWADAEPAQTGTTPGSELHTFFTLQKEGDTIGLFKPDNTLVDTVTFGAQVQDQSEGRWLDGAVAPFFKMVTPTPGKSNVIPVPTLITELGALIDYLPIDQVEAKARRSDRTFTFFRSFVPYFYDRLKALKANSGVMQNAGNVQGWCAGDPHPENFGTIYDRDGNILFTINDIDDAGPCPMVADVVRFLTAIYIDNPNVNFKDILAAYTDGLNGLNANAEYFEVLDDLISESQDDGLRAERSYVQPDMKTLVRRDDTAEIPASLKTLLESTMKSVLDDTMVLRDALERFKYTGGSAGLRRFEVLARIANRSYPFHIEFKEVARPGIYPLATNNIYPPSVQRYSMTLLLEQKGRQLPFYKVTRVGNWEMQTRPRIAGNKGVDLKDYTGNNLTDLFKAEAWTLGDYHARAVQNPKLYRTSFQAISLQDWMRAMVQMNQVMKTAYTHVKNTNLLASGFTYPKTDITVTTNQAIFPFLPTLYGGTSPGTFSTSPVLPAGLTINPTTGVISGTPTTAAAKKLFYVFAAGFPGQSYPINITVVAGSAYPANPTVAAPPPVYTTDGLSVWFESTALQNDSANSVNMGSYLKQEPIEGRVFLLKNTSNSTINLTSIVAPSGFSIVRKLNKTTLTYYGETTSFMVQPVTTTVGNKSGTFVINYTSGTAKTFKIKLAASVFENGSLASPTSIPSVSPGYVPLTMSMNVKNPNFTEYGSEILALSRKSQTQSDFNTWRPKLGLSPMIKNITAQLPSTSAGRLLADLLVASRYSDISAGARQLMSSTSALLEPETNNALNLIKTLMQTLTGDPDGYGRAMLVSLAMYIKNGSAALRGFSQDVLAGDRVTTYANLSTLGQINVRAAYFRAYLSTKPSRKDTLALILPIVKRLERNAKVPLVHLYFTTFNEYLTLLSPEDLADLASEK